MNILLVDDQPAGLLALEAILDGLGQNLVTAQSGAEALRKVLAMDFAVILLDIQMPGIDGLETAALIRERDRSRLTPIIFVTASSNDAQVVRGYAAGAVDYVVKPIVPEILRSKVSIFVEMAKNAELVRQAKESAERANRELESFSYSVSHDLRAPLRSLDGFSQLILEEHSAGLDETGRDHLRRILDAARRMGQLIDDLLGLAGVTRSELNREDLDLSAMAREVLKRIGADSGARQVELKIQDGVRVAADRQLVLVLLENLLGNAWKFTGKAAHPRIDFGVEWIGGAPVFFVRDNGAGFDMSQASRLFAPFRRLHAAAEFEGTGVGLATVRRIVERHGGRIWASSQIGAGASFHFTLAGPDANGLAVHPGGLA